MEQYEMKQIQIVIQYSNLSNDRYISKYRFLLKTPALNTNGMKHSTFKCIC